MEIRAGLVMGTSGEEVGALHDALTVIGLQIEVAERETKLFGASTVAAVIKLQALAGLEQTGVVDENTLTVITVALDRLGIQAGGAGFVAKSVPYSVDGTVTDTDGLPLAKAKTVAFDCELRSRKRIGDSVTDATGAYRIAYEAGDLYKGRTAADLQVDVQGDAGKTLLSSPIAFSAPRQATVNLALGGPAHAQPSEYSAITNAVTPLLGKVSPAEIEQNDEHQDLTFIAGQTGFVQERVGYWTVGARLAISTELPAELFYGLFRSGVPADAHVTALASSSAGIDFDTNAQTLLEGVLATSASTVRAAVASAIAGNVIPASFAGRSADDLARLATLAGQAALTSTQGFGKTSFAGVLGTVGVESDVQTRFVALYTAAVGSARRTFWSDLAENPDFTADQVATLRFGVTTGRFTRGYVPLLTELAAQRSVGQISSAADLARLTAADWLALLDKPRADGTPIGAPPFIDASTMALANEAYADMLERHFTTAYPTTAFAARVAVDAEAPFAAAAPTAAFLNANTAFDLRRTNIDAFAIKTPIPEAVRPTLLIAQRLIKLNSNYSVMSALMAAGVQSAQQIYFMGRDRFVADYASLPALGATEAVRTWARAEQTYAVALAIATKFNATLGAASPVVVGDALPPDAATQVAQFPNLTTLFGSDSLCQCEDCQSVLGAPAYLVDILDFLEQRQASAGSTTTVRDVLFERRADLPQILLNCENTDTELPYIDLANELLEAAVATPDPLDTLDPSNPSVRQTTLTTSELNANPEYVNNSAYATLAGAVYPWMLPFDLPLAEARAYLGQLNLSRARLIRTFEAPAGYPSAQADELAREQLGLSAVQADIITAGPLATGLSWDYWQLAQGPTNSIVDPDDPTKLIPTGTWIQVLSYVRVLLARASLEYEDLAHLLNTMFVNGDGAVTISNVPADSCAVSTMMLNGLTQDVLDRIHRFVRLWRCLGWGPYDLDNAIASLQSTTAAGLGQLSDELLRQLACVSGAMKAYSLSVPSAVALFAPTPTSVTIATREIPTLPGDEPVYSLYHDLFQNLTVLNPPDEIFTLNAQGTEIAAIASAPQLTDATHAAALIAAFQISGSDLTLAITAFTDGKLTLANLSALYRDVELAAMLGITITELISLLAFAEAPIPAAPGYEVVTPFDGTRPESLATFAGVYSMLAGSGLSIEQVDYTIRDADDGTGVAPDPVAVGTVLLALHTGLGKIVTENAFSADPTGKQARKALSVLLGAADVNTAMAILDGTTSQTTADQDTFITTVLSTYMDAGEAEANVVGASGLAAGQPRFEYVLRNLLDYQVKTQSTHLIVQTLAQQFGIENQTAALVLQSWFPSATTPGAFLITDFLALPAIALTHTTDPIAPTTPGFEPYFTSYAALAKAALLITTLKLGVDDVSWWQSSGVPAGWLDPTTLRTTFPTTPAPAPQSSADGRYSALGRLIAGAKVRGGVPIPNATFKTLFTPAATLAKSVYLAQLANLTQWPADTLAVLCGDPASTSTAQLGELSLAYPSDYEAEVALSRLLACETVLSQTGIPADVSSWTATAVSSDTANAIKQSVKANYPEEQWLTLAKQLRDPLRDAQRDALVAYLLAGPPPAGWESQWLDPDDVFGYFLIDVEMCACMATSRIVQATATVQLFVLRCFLGLEPSVTVDATVDAKWLQWQWMSQYRLWEANREVFLWPENWIDPTLRPNASPFFAALRQDLSQGDLAANTSDVAQTALQNYLEKLETVSRLDVCGYFHDVEDGGESVLRVLARTQGTPPVYFTRQWINSSLWTAWEQVDLDIASNHVLPIVWNGRQYIFWAITSVKADENNQNVPSAQTSSTPPPAPHNHLEVQLAWSQYKQGKWQAKQVAPQTLVFGSLSSESFNLPGVFGSFEIPFDWNSTEITLKTSQPNGEQLQVDVYLDGWEFSATRVGNSDSVSSEIFNSPRYHSGRFLLGGAGSGVELFAVSYFASQLENAGGGTPVDQVGELQVSMIQPSISTPSQSSFDGDWLAGSDMNFLSPARPRFGPMTASYQMYTALTSERLLSQADYYRLITPHQTPTFDSTLPFFYRDSAREYFIVASDYYRNGNYLTPIRPEYVYDPSFTAEYTFWTFYHPWVSLFVAQLNTSDGIDALYAQQVQLNPAGVAGTPVFDFHSYYEPTEYVLQPYPQEDVDFGSPPGSPSVISYSIYNSPYALYNWELFFHVPFLIANALSTDQQFQQAKLWYEYVFKPSGTAVSTPPGPPQQRYWITKPFWEMTAADYASQQLDTLMQEINQGSDLTSENEVAAWRADPFDPDALAQLRPVAYQRALVMAYISNLIAWGDQLFTQDTMETINLATQMYVLASELLGPQPEIVPPLVEPAAMTYAQLEGSLDAFSNATVVAENAIPPVSANVPTPSGSQSLPSLSTMYFQIPPNTQLLGYWTTLAGRLFNLRHCMNIEGIVQQLPLFSPPINPALLVQAAAARLDLSSILSDTSAAVPPYRFRTLIRHALDLCDQVRSLGAELLAALEKSDAEHLARIRSSGEINLQSAIDEVRARQIDAATQEIAVLGKARQTFQDRASFYVGRALMNEWEAAALVLRVTALVPQTKATLLDGEAAIAHILPSLSAGVAGAGGTPNVTVSFGGENIGAAANAAASIQRVMAAIIQTGAELSATLGGYHQRQDAWTMEGIVAQDEMARIDAETVAAQIRLDVAGKEKTAQDVAVTNAQNVDGFLHSKFTNQELYDWMVGQTSTTYFQAYQLAYSIAKAAEQCFERELALTDTGYIQFGYWDSLHQGLTAGEKLHYDLSRMESAFYTQNDRELEIVKHVSLVQLDPYALVELRETGNCQIDLPEILFDLDNPGHYMRRLKTVGVTVPCVVGPYTSVSATLTLMANQIRTSTDPSGGYERTGLSDARFLDDPGGSSEIVTSTAHNDSGLFELRFEDERYLPFEDAGAISNWHLTLNNVYPQFDYTTITDVVIHLRYTARDGGGTLGSLAAAAAKAKLNATALADSRTGLYRLFSARHEYPTQWAQFLGPASGADQILTLPTPPERFPFFTNGLDLKVRSLDVLTNTTDTGAYTLELTPPGGALQTLTMNPDATLDGMHHINVALSPNADLGRAPTSSTATPPTWTVKLKQAAASDYQSLGPQMLDDLLVVLSYEVSP